MRDYIIAYPLVKVFMKGPNSEDIQAERRTAIAIVLHSGTTMENAVFCVGEALCNPKDNFCKSTGNTIAINRARHGANDACLMFTAEEALTLVEYEDGALDSATGDSLPESVVLSSVSHTPIPHGLLSRLNMLLPLASV